MNRDGIPGNVRYEVGICAPTLREQRSHNAVSSFDELEATVLLFVEESGHSWRPLRTPMCAA